MQELKFTGGVDPTKALEQIRDYADAVLKAFFEPSKIHFWVDGWCTNNGQPDAEAGWTVKELTEAGRVLHIQAGFVPDHLPQTSSVAEYMAVIDALKLALNAGGPMQFVIHTDSQLVVNQLDSGPDAWAIKVGHLLPLWEEAAQLMDETGATLVKEPRARIKTVVGH